MTGEPLSILQSYGLLLAIGVTGGLADIWIYRWARSGGVGWFGISCCFWLMSLILFAFLLKWDNRAFSASFILSSVAHIVLVMICDVTWFGSRLSRTEWIGIGFAMVSIVVLEIGRESAPSPEDAASGDGEVTLHQGDEP